MLVSIAKPEQRRRVRFANLNYEAAVTHRMRRGGLFVTAAGVVLVLVSTSGCGKSVSSSDIAAYGVDRFVSNVLAFTTTHAVPESIQREFSPKRVEEQLNGVLLVYSESSRWTQGIYVDRNDIRGWGGTGFEVEPWFQQVAWVHIKKRSTKQFHLNQAAEEVALIEGYYSSDLKTAEKSLLGLDELYTSPRYDKIDGVRTTRALTHTRLCLLYSQIQQTNHAALHRIEALKMYGGSSESTEQERWTELLQAVDALDRNREVKWKTQK